MKAKSLMWLGNLHQVFCYLSYQGFYFLFVSMAWIIQFDSQMLKDGYSVSAAMVYGYLWWSTCKTQQNTALEPSLGLMSNALCLNRRTIIRAVQELERKGLIEVIRSNYSKNIYLLEDINKYPAITGGFDEDRLFDTFRSEKIKKMKRLQQMQRGGQFVHY